MDFPVQFVLAVTVVFLIIFIAFIIRCGSLKMRKLMQALTCRTGKIFPQVDVCMNPKCRELEGKMVAYMRKVLSFEEKRNELESVIEQLKEQQTFHHKEDKEERRHEMMQCIRTTLVKHPDDLRGRRRANQARQILIYQVYAELDIAYHIETFLRDIQEHILTNKTSKIIFKWICISLSSLKALLVWAFDVSSDIAILLVMISCSDQVAQLLEAFRSDKMEIITSCSVPINTTSILQDFIREDIPMGKVEGQLVLIQNIFSKYLFQLKFVFVFTTIAQGLKAILISEVNWVDGKGSSIITFCLFGANFLVSPILLLFQLPLREIALRDPKQEIASSGKYRKEISLNRNRYQGSIIEAFLESLQSCKTQTSFYLAFSYIAETPAYGGSAELMNLVLKDKSEVFSFSEVGWHGMPILAFSAMMSLISITLAQYKLYSTRHGYDMSFLGKVFYFLSALLATYVKLASQIMLYTIYIILVLEPDNSDTQFFLLQLPNILIVYLQLQIVSVINWWTASSKVPDSGYSLTVYRSPVWPTTSNLSMEANRLRKLKTEELYVKYRPKYTFFQNLWRTLKGPNIAWYVNIIIPFLGLSTYTSQRLNDAPQQFSFNSSGLSRNKFRFRFLLNIGLNFGLIFSTLILGWLFLLLNEDTIDLEKQLATQNALYIWISLIPSYFLALFLFKMFYDKCHVWRKENVVVGYEFTDEIDPGKEWEQKHFKGHWVAHTNYPWVAHDDKTETVEATDENGGFILTENIAHNQNDQIDGVNGLYVHTVSIGDLEQLTIVQAIESGNLECVKHFLDSGIAINEKDDENLTLLHRAVISNKAEIVEHLLKVGAEVDVEGGDLGYTALQEAVENDNIEVVKILVNKGGARIFQRNSNGQSAFRIARNHQPIRRFLCTKHSLFFSCKTYRLPWMILVSVLHVLSIVGIVIIMFDHLYLQAHDFIFC